MKAQAPHAALGANRARLRLDAGVGDGDAAQPLRKALQRIEHDAIVVDVGVALHHEAVGEAEMIEQRDQSLDRRVGRRVGAARLVGKFVGRPENVEMRVPGARRRAQPRPFRMPDRPGDTRRFVAVSSSVQAVPTLNPI